MVKYKERRRGCTTRVREQEEVGQGKEKGRGKGKYSESRGAWAKDWGRGRVKGLAYVSETRRKWGKEKGKGKGLPYVSERRRKWVLRESLRANCRRRRSAATISILPHPACAATQVAGWHSDTQ